MKVVRFVKTFRMYQPGERAGFAKAEAEALIAQGFAVDQEALDAQQAEANAVAARAELVAAVLEQVSIDDYTKTGRPDVDAVNRLLPEGEPPVSAEERDAVWAALQAG